MKHQSQEKVTQMKTKIEVCINIISIIFFFPAPKTHSCLERLIQVTLLLRFLNETNPKLKASGAQSKIFNYEGKHNKVNQL